MNRGIRLAFVTVLARFGLVNAEQAHLSLPCQHGTVRFGLVWLCSVNDNRTVLELEHAQSAYKDGRVVARRVPLREIGYQSYRLG